MTRRIRRVVAATVAAAAVVAAIVVERPADALTGAARVGWQVDDVPLDAVFYDVAAVGGGTWAVGARMGEDFTALAVRWDGRRWTAVDVPDAAGGRLDGVDGVSARDVWAVGSTGPNTWAVHWDGRRWQVVPTADQPGGSTRLSRVDAVSANDAWAVGVVDADNRQRGIVQHWNGRKWSAVALPDDGLGDYTLSAVHAVGPADVWVGGMASAVDQPVAFHWDGRRWSRAALPPLKGFVGVSIEAIVARTASDVWALGWTQVDVITSRRPLALHFNGRVWTVSPTPDTSHSEIVDAIEWNGEIWAAGYGPTPFLMRYRGGWESAATPPISEGTFFGLATVPGRGLLAVGAQPGPGGAPRPLVAWYCKGAR